MYFIKEMKEENRPRERLIEKGAAVLSDEELLALILRSGNKDMSVINLSKTVLSRIDEISDLNSITYRELIQIPGIKEAKATTLLAAIELGKRLSKKYDNKKNLIRENKDVYYLLHDDLFYLEQEHFICLYLDAKGHLIKRETLFIGTLNHTVIHPRDIFRLAVKFSAHSFLIVHNHPSGDSTPSKTDFDVTYKINDAALMLGINMINHIIIGKNEFYSIKEKKKFFMQ